MREGGGERVMEGGRQGTIDHTHTHCIRQCEAKKERKRGTLVISHG